MENKLPLIGKDSSELYFNPMEAANDAKYITKTEKYITMIECDEFFTTTFINRSEFAVDIKSC